MTWPWLVVMLSLLALLALLAEIAPSPLSPAQIVSMTGQALLSEQSKDDIWACCSGGPLTKDADA